MRGRRKWRTVQDSNLRDGDAALSVSNRAPSAAQPTVREVVVPEGVEPSRLSATVSETAMSTVPSGDCEVADGESSRTLKAAGAARWVSNPVQSPICLPIREVVVAQGIEPRTQGFSDPRSTAELRHRSGVSGGSRTRVDRVATGRVAPPPR